MSKVRDNFNYSNLSTLDDLKRFLSVFLDNLTPIVNGNIEFDLNIKTKTVTANFLTANTELEVTHNLGRVPVGYLLAQSNVSTTLFNGVSTNTDSKIYLKSSAIANTTIIVF